MAITIVQLEHSSNYSTLMCLLQNQRQGNENKAVNPNESIFWVFCRTGSAAWQGVFPILFRAPTRVSATCVEAITAMNAMQTGSDGLREGIIAVPLKKSLLNGIIRNNHARYIRSNQSGKVVIVIPPLITKIQTYFCSLLIRFEHLWIQMVSLNAWISTLGGGYFLCRHLETAVHMARKQRAVALWMGDESTADRCTLNEAFNYIHAGRFGIATAMIRSVTLSSEAREDTLVLKMCFSAKLFLKRVRRAGKFEGDRDKTTDDYQRIRIVQDRSKRPVV